jgi:protein involved in polysaccharide export with SLBB domain
MMALLVIAAATLAGQALIPGAQAEMGANLPALPIGPNDLLAISVYAAPELTRTVRVSAEGLIRLPMLHEKIEAQGLMPAELETRIAAVLSEEEILVEPVVTVAIAEYHSRPISVAGAVKTPLTFQAAGRTTLLEALTRAQGLTEEAGSEILVTRPSKTGEPALLTRIPVKGLIDAADPQWNIPLEGGATEVVVWDGHDGSKTLSTLDIHPKARLLMGTPVSSTLELNSSYSAVVFIGQHAVIFDRPRLNLLFCRLRAGAILSKQSFDISVSAFPPNGRHVVLSCWLSAS